MGTIVQTMQSSASTTNIHSSATTATVHEHACLFTHDLRRKQKRWQDGRLKYHTFNKRVMVYDERGNFVGDTHWREDYDLAEGDDLELERGGIIIQVGECVGSRDQDLSELVDKRARERAQRQAAAAAARQPPTTPGAPLDETRPQPLARKHLHEVIGTPSGHYGRALPPTESPYEERRRTEAAARGDGPRPTKRQRKDVSPPSKSGYAQSLFGATLTLSGRPLSQAPPRHHAPKISRGWEENTLSPSPDTSNHRDHPDPSLDKAQAPTASRDQHSSSPGNAPLLVSKSQIPRSHFPSLHNPPRLKPLLGAHPDKSDEPANALVSQRERSHSVTTRDKGTINRHSISSSQNHGQNLSESREMNESLAPKNRLIDRSGHLPTLGIPDNVQNKYSMDVSNGCADSIRHRDTNTVGLARNHRTAPQTEPACDELRTELKIKPRKKRGLLLITERHNSCSTSSSKPELAKTRPVAHVPLLSDVQPANNSTDGEGEKVKWAGMQHSRVGFLEDNQNIAPQRINTKEDGDGDNDSDDNDITEIESGLRLKKQLLTGNPIPPNNVDRRGRLVSTGRENTTGDEIPGPRLARLGRKSIKSREVIGLVFEGDPNPAVGVEQNTHSAEEPSLEFHSYQGTEKQHHKMENKGCHPLAASEARLDPEPQPRRKGLLAARGSAVLPRQSSRASKLPNNEANLTIQNEETSSTVTMTITKQSVPQITNPATRGKKAAKPSDAAGQMPACPLPTETAGGLLLRQNPRKMTAQKYTDNRSASSLPGFSRVNGGPWSREADDLFDFKRPS